MEMVDGQRVRVSSIQGGCVRANVEVACTHRAISEALGVLFQAFQPPDHQRRELDRADALEPLPVERGASLGEDARSVPIKVGP
jgi:hypothetical protein